MTLCGKPQTSYGKPQTTKTYRKTSRRDVHVFPDSLWTFAIQSEMSFVTDEVPLGEREKVQCVLRKH